MSENLMSEIEEKLRAGKICANRSCMHGKNTRPDGKKKDGHGGKSGACFCGCKVFVREGVEVVDGKAPRAQRRGKIESRPSLTGHLPGLEPKMLPSVHSAIEEYVDVRDRKKKLTELEAEKKEHLVYAMKKAGITEYNVDGHRATLEANEKVKAVLDETREETEVRAGVGARVDSVGA